ncbi:TIGR03086 family protein [Nocardia beijingensis]|uniref:TIGR03086 family metal-binding protein n=1 Tax=Nocardia beijingensis TaxID=95162 RepID=UPI001894418D|nr:TIGR03086 family metal-binding protein [Nocardia beijingensis]MBF6468497.1 TIGR03086 family protein [Nocardia beijingensis]
MTTDAVARDVAAELRALDRLTADVDIVALHARAVRTSIEVVAQVAPSQLRRATPCAAWTLHGLLAHMIAQHYGFAAASRGDDSMTPWKLRPLGPEPAEDYRQAAEHALAAFGREGVLDRRFTLPELSPTHQFSGRQAISFHFLDYVVHSWDVAQTIDTTVRFDDEVLESALVAARAAAGGEARLLPGAAFGPAVPSEADGGLDAIIALLGRSPDWMN